MSRNPRQVPEEKRRVVVLYTTNQDGSVQVGQAFLDAAVANSQARGVLISIISPSGAIDTRMFVGIKKQEALWIGSQVGNSVLNER